MKRSFYQMIVVTLCLVGCAATHYHERQLDHVTFYLRAPGAKNVEFVSSLDAYNPHRANRLKGTHWAVTVTPDSEFRYFYIVDGSVYLPECDLYEKDDFGFRNCVFVPER
jgi:hypothetical protein